MRVVTLLTRTSPVCVQVEKARHVLLLREKLQEQNKTHELTKLDKEASNMSKKGRLLKEKVCAQVEICLGWVVICACVHLQVCVRGHVRVLGVCGVYLRSG